MHGMWYKLCPQCRNYMKKADPQESSTCCACGWEEYIPPYYCEFVHTFCAHLSANGVKKASESDQSGNDDRAAITPP